MYIMRSISTRTERVKGSTCIVVYSWGYSIKPLQNKEQNENSLKREECRLCGGTAHSKGMIIT